MDDRKVLGVFRHVGAAERALLTTCVESDAAAKAQLGEAKRQVQEMVLPEEEFAPIAAEVAARLQRCGTRCEVCVSFRDATEGVAYPPRAVLQSLRCDMLSDDADAVELCSWAPGRMDGADRPLSFTAPVPRACSGLRLRFTFAPAHDTPRMYHLELASRAFADALYHQHGVAAAAAAPWQASRRSTIIRGVFDYVSDRGLLRTGEVLLDAPLLHELRGCADGGSDAALGVDAPGQHRPRKARRVVVPVADVLERVVAALRPPADFEAEVVFDVRAMDGDGVRTEVDLPCTKARSEAAQFDELACPAALQRCEAKLRGVLTAARAVQERIDAYRRVCDAPAAAVRSILEARLAARGPAHRPDAAATTPP